MEYPTGAVTGGSAGSNTSPVQKVVNAVKAATTATVKATATTAVQMSNQVATTVKTVSEKIINTVDTVKKEVSAAATSTVNKVMQTAANQASSIKQNTAEAAQKLTNVATAAVKTPQKTAVTLGQQVMKQTTVAMQEMPKYTGATQYIQKPTTSFTPTPAMPAKDVMTTASLLTATYLNNKINSDLNGLRKAAVNSFSVDKWMDTAAGEIYNYIANISNPFFVATTGGKLIVDPLFRNMSLKESLQESIAFSKGYNGASLKMLQGAVEGLLSLPETMDSLKKCIDENGIKQTAKDIACSVVEDAVKIWEEDIKNGNARSRGEIIGDFRMLVGGKILGDALVAARAGKLTTKLDDISDLGKTAGKVKGGTVPDFYVGTNGKALPSQYKNWVGTNIQKELLDQAENPQLQNAIKQLYRENSFIGDGGTADVIRFEQQTGLMLGKNGGSHVQKGIDMAKYIENKILTQDLSPSDSALTKQLLEDLHSALGR